VEEDDYESCVFASRDVFIFSVFTTKFVGLEFWVGFTSFSILKGCAIGFAG